MISKVALTFFLITIIDLSATADYYCEKKDTSQGLRIAGAVYTLLGIPADPWVGAFINSYGIKRMHDNTHNRLCEKDAYYNCMGQCYTDCFSNCSPYCHSTEKRNEDCWWKTK